MRGLNGGAARTAPYSGAGQASSVWVTRQPFRQGPAVHGQAGSKLWGKQQFPPCLDSLEAQAMSPGRDTAFLGIRCA